MLPDSPQNLVIVRTPSPSIHYDHLFNYQQQNSFHQSWCLTNIKVIKVIIIFFHR